MKHFISIIALPIVALCAACHPVEPKPDDDDLNHTLLTVSEELFLNPERGFHKAIEVHSAEPAPFTDLNAKAMYNAGYSLIHFDFYMEDYRDTLISDAYLDVVRQSLQALRAGGCKGVIRFAYTNNENQSPREAKEELMLQHIEQIKPILQEYVDRSGVTLKKQQSAHVIIFFIS